MYFASYGKACCTWSSLSCFSAQDQRDSLFHFCTMISLASVCYCGVMSHPVFPVAFILPSTEASARNLTLGVYAHSMPEHRYVTCPYTVMCSRLYAGGGCGRLGDRVWLLRLVREVGREGWMHLDAVSWPWLGAGLGVVGWMHLNTVRWPWLGAGLGAGG